MADRINIVGENIKRFRKKANLTQKELAEKCGFAEITIRQYENGKRAPKIETMQKIATVLAVPISDLIQSSPEIDPNSLHSITSSVEKIQKKYNHDSSALVSVQKGIKEANKVQKSIHSIENLSKDIQKIRKIEDSVQRYFNTDTVPSDNTDIRELSLADLVLLDVFHTLNEQGQDKIIIYLDDIAGNPKYRADVAPDQDETAQDETVSSKQEEPDKNQ